MLNKCLAYKHFLQKCYSNTKIRGSENQIAFIEDKTEKLILLDLNNNFQDSYLSNSQAFLFFVHKLFTLLENCVVCTLYDRKYV